MWSSSFNPYDGFEALLSSDEPRGADGGPFASNSQSPPIWSRGPSSDESLFDNSPLSVMTGSDLFQDPPSCPSPASRIELPGGGFIELPAAVQETDHDPWQSNPRSKDTFSQQEQRLLVKIASLEHESAQKDHYISQMNNENYALHQESNRLGQILNDQSVEMYQLRFEATRYANDSATRIGELEQETRKLQQLLSAEKKTSKTRKDLLWEALEERKTLKIQMKENVTSLEKRIRDLTTASQIMEHEMLLIPRMMTTFKPKPKPATIPADVHLPSRAMLVLSRCVDALASHPYARKTHFEPEEERNSSLPHSSLGNSSRVTKCVTDAEEIVVVSSELVTEERAVMKQGKLLSLRRWFSRKRNSE